MFQAAIYFNVSSLINPRFHFVLYEKPWVMKLSMCAKKYKGKKKVQRKVLVEIEKAFLNKTWMGLYARFAQGCLGFTAINYYLIPAENDVL